MEVSQACAVSLQVRVQLCLTNISDSVLGMIPHLKITLVCSRVRLLLFV